MRISRKVRRRLAGALVITAVALAVSAVVVRTWVVPKVIIAQIGKFYGGKVEVRSWWLDRHSAGLVGVVLHEGKAADSPEWLTAERVSTDLSLDGLLRGQFVPTKVVIERPKLALRFDGKNQMTSKIPLIPQPQPKGKGDAKAVPLPELVIADGSVSVKQEGREELSIAVVGGSLNAKDGREILDAATEDPTWGRFALSGDFAPDFQEGVVRLATGPNLVVDQNKTSRLPFVPTDVWTNLEPRGPVEAKVQISLNLKDPTPVHVHTDIELHHVSAKLQTLGITATDTTGQIVVDDDKVTVRNLEGKTLGGNIGAGGRLDFDPRQPPRFDMAMTLNQIDITQAPKAWQLDKVGANGRLSGDVDLKVALAPNGPDLTGTVGRAVIEGGSFQGIPVKSLSVTMRAEGQNLQYDAGLPGSSPTMTAADGSPIPPKEGDAPEAALWNSLEEAVPLLTIWNGGRLVSGWIASEMKNQKADPAKTGKGGITLPRTVSTEVELEDVDLDMILDKARKYGIKIPVPVAGKFTLKAKATIPIASPGDLKQYLFHGEASLKAASIDHVDIGRIDAKLDLADGVLELSDFRGQFVDHPSGDDDHPPIETGLPARDGALAAGGFRGGVKIQLAPRGRLSAHFEGHDLPLGELAAPALPVPTPLSGLLSLKAEASADIALLGDPTAWTVAGHADSRRIKYQGAVLDQVATRIRLGDGKASVEEFTATLAGRPLTANANLAVASPYAFDGRVDVKGWELSEILAFVPGVPRPSPASGTIDAQGEANGTLTPFAIQTRGSARILRAKTEAGPMGNLVLQWTTDRDAIAITGVEAQTFGGRLSAEARIPIKAGSPLEASANFKGIDLAPLASTLLGDELKLTGLADGRVKVVMPLDASSIDADVRINAPDLTVRGIPAESAHVTVKGVKDRLDFEVTAESLGGQIRFTGTAPVGGDRTKMIVNAELQAAGFQMLSLWRGLGLSGEITKFNGLAAVAMNLRATVKPFALWARGGFEFRDLHMESPRVPIGGLRGDLSRTPTTWRVDKLVGDLFGGPLNRRSLGRDPAGQDAHRELRRQGRPGLARQDDARRAVDGPQRRGRGVAPGPRPVRWDLAGRQRRRHPSRQGLQHPADQPPLPGRTHLEPGQRHRRVPLPPVDLAGRRRLAPGQRHAPARQRALVSG